MDILYCIGAGIFIGQPELIGSTWVSDVNLRLDIKLETQLLANRYVPLETGIWLMNNIAICDLN